MLRRAAQLLYTTRRTPLHDVVQLYLIGPTHLHSGDVGGGVRSNNHRGKPENPPARDAHTHSEKHAEATAGAGRGVS